MLITQTQYGQFVLVAIIFVLALEVVSLFMSVFMRSPFGLFASLAAFCGTITGVLTINASRDWSGHFKHYKSINGVDTWRTTDTLFWAHIDPVFIEAPFYVAILSAIAASIAYVIQARRLDAKLERLEELEEAARPKRKPTAQKKTDASDPATASITKQDSSDAEEPAPVRVPKRSLRRKLATS